MKFVVRYNDNWSDEMDVNGFAIMSKIQLEAYKKKVKNAAYPITYYVGTNEEIEFGSSEDVFDKLKITSISDTELRFLRKIFKPYKHSNLEISGTFPDENIFDSDDEDYEY